MRAALYVLAVCLGYAALALGDTPPAVRSAIVVEIKDAIGPATKDHFLRALEKAEARRAEMLVLVLDTPGGLDAAMRDMVQAILNARVPVVTFVAPSGARAASAGTYILYASHVAAMAPGTNLGAATPVPIGGSPPPEPGKSPPAGAEGDGKTAPESPGSASDRKAVNDAVAYIRSLAQMRGRNAEWAEEAVRGAASLTASDALARNVIDLVAADLPELLAALDGREVTVSGATVTLRTAGLTLERHERDWRTDLLAVLTNPLVAYGLLIIGLYGLLFEGYNPGAILPGVVGAICLLLGLYALQVLSVNYAGLALVGLGVAMMIAEVFVPSFGALGLGGLAAFIIGSIILMDTEAPGFGVHLGLVAGVALTAGVAMFGTVWLAVRARRRPVTTGAEQLIGAEGVALGAFERRGRIRVVGEEWSAETTAAVADGQRVIVEGLEGLTLKVRPKD